MNEEELLAELGMNPEDLIPTETEEAGEIDFDNFTSASPAQERSVQPQGSSSGAVSEAIHVEQLKEVKVPITVELGRTKKTLAELEMMTKGSIIALGTKVDDPIFISCQGKAFAEAEVVDMEGELHLVITKVLTQS